MGAHIRIEHCCDHCGKLSLSLVTVPRLYPRPVDAPVAPSPSIPPEAPTTHPKAPEPPPAAPEIHVP